MNTNVVGMRFHPADEEIVGYYLVNKINGNEHLVDHVIGEVDLYQHEPWNLPNHSRKQTNDQVWYFFGHHQNLNSGKVKRKISSGVEYWKGTRKIDTITASGVEIEKSTNGGGYWKGTGHRRIVKASNSGVEIGNKRGLVFTEEIPKERLERIGSHMNTVLATPMILPRMNTNVVGMRFHPADEEIVSYYLVNKINGNEHPVDHVIGEVDLYQHEPWNLPNHSRRQTNDQVWYFFGHHQNLNSGKVKRKISSGAGYWKRTGKIDTITTSDVEIGKKRTLVFQSKDPTSKEYVNTAWVVKEYNLTNVPSQLVLWKLKYKGNYLMNNQPSDEELQMVQINEEEEEIDQTALEFADSCLNYE